MGGGGSTAEKYAKFGAGEYDSSDFERYVDSRGDLAAAWGKIESDPTAWDSKYWIDKGATSKSAFGRAHAAEDAELYAGTYGDAGDTKVLPGTDAYDSYFGDSSGTYFDDFISEPASAEGGGGRSGISSAIAANPFFPQLVPEYTPQGLLDWSGYMPEGSMFGHEQYQPWTNPNAIPDNIFNYQPPTIHAGSGIRGGGISSGGPSGGSSGGSSGGYSGGSSSVSHTPVGNISTGSSSSAGDVYTPFMADAPVLGTRGEDTGHTMEEVMAMTDASTPYIPTAYSGLKGSPDLQHDRAVQLIDMHKQQALIDYKPELEEDFYSIGLGGNYRYDQAQANIDATIREIQKANANTIFGSGRQAANRSGPSRGMIGGGEVSGNDGPGEPDHPGGRSDL